MAKQNLLVISQFPVGTLNEVKEMGGDPRNVASCSEPSEKNAGCKGWATCRFREYRDTGIGPEMIGTDIITPEGAATVVISPCYDFYYTDLKTRFENMATSGAVINPRWRVGDKVMKWSSQAVHATPQPTTCVACKTNTCFKRHEVEYEEEILPFRRPDQVYKRAGYAERMRAEATAALEKDTVLANLGHTQSPRVKDKGGNRS